MAGISKKTYKLKNGKIIIKYTITYRDILGNQHTSGSYATKKDAKKDLNKFNNHEIKINNSNITLGDILKLFMDKAKRKYADSTIKNYTIFIKLYLAELKDIKYLKLNSVRIQEFFDNLLKNKGAFIAEKCLKICKSASNYAIKHSLIQNNIFNTVEKIIPSGKKHNHFELSELVNLLEKSKEFMPIFYPLLFTFIGTGMREGEIFALEKSDINFKKNTISINKQFTGGKLKNWPKTDKSNRDVYMFDELAQVLKNHIQNLPDGAKLVFSNNVGGYLNPSNFRERFWKPFLIYCGYSPDYARLHDLRGSYIDLILSNNLSGKFAQNQVGHSKWETTYNVYAKNNKDMVTRAMNKINNVFRKCEQNVSNEVKEEEKSNIIPFKKQAAKTH